MNEVPELCRVSVTGLMIMILDLWTYESLLYYKNIDYCKFQTSEKKLLNAKRAFVEKQHPKKMPRCGRYLQLSISMTRHQHLLPLMMVILIIDSFLSMFSQIHCRGRCYGPFERVQHLCVQNQVKMMISFVSAHVS